MGEAKRRTAEERRAAVEARDAEERLQWALPYVNEAAALLGAAGRLVLAQRLLAQRSERDTIPPTPEETETAFRLATIAVHLVVADELRAAVEQEPSEEDQE